MKTKSAAIAKCRKLWGSHFDSFVVYQFPRGHWGYASIESPIGQDLQATGEIYSARGGTIVAVKAQQWEIVSNHS